AAFARRADQRRLEARRGDAALRQRPGDQLGLPRSVGIAPPMLQGAAAADLEVRAGRCFAMTRWRHHLDEIGRHALAALRARLGYDRFAGQGKGYEVAPALVLGDAVAERADFQDVERDAHIPPSQLFAGRISPTSRPTTFLTGGLTSASRWSSGNTPRWFRSVAMAISDARPAPSHIFSAMPSPSVGSMPQN